jgi:hypothetical protein
VLQGRSAPGRRFALGRAQGNPCSALFGRAVPGELSPERENRNGAKLQRMGLCWRKGRPAVPASPSRGLNARSEWEDERARMFAREWSRRLRREPQMI